MKNLLFLLTFLTLSFAGHIYVSDATLDYQNKLYFKLENCLNSGEVLRVVWPFSFDTTPSAKITITGSTTNLASATVNESSSTSVYLITMGSNLNAGQWYSLNLSISTGLTSITAQYYDTPIQLATYSGKSSSAITNYQLYDYNNACGFVAIAPAPAKLANVSLSLSATSENQTSNIIENTYFEQSYNVYLTVKTTNNYESGGTYYFKMTGPFTWSGGVEVISKNCTENDTGCTPILPLTLNRDYTYKVTDTLLTFVRYQNSTKLAIANTEYLKLKIKVNTPNYVSTTGTMSVYLVSNYANYIYEYSDESTNFFSTSKIGITTSSTKFLWGVPYDDGLSKGCPIRVYLSDNYAIWNKITLSFQPTRAFPESEGFKMKVNVNNSLYVNDMSIYTDMTQMSSLGAISCLTDVSSKYIICQNIGKLSASVTKSIKFAYVVQYSATLDLDDFGKFEFYHQEGSGEKANQITVTASPSNTGISGMTTIVKNADYNKHFDIINPVADVPTTFDHYITNYTDVFKAAKTTSDGRSSIKYQNGTFDLLVLIEAKFEQQCCGETAPEVYGEQCETKTWKTGATNTYCKANSSASLVIKILANNFVLSFGENYDSENNKTIFKGVEIMHTSDGDTAAKTFYGETKTILLTQNCLHTDGDTNDIQVCNDNYDATTYIPLATLHTDSKYTYNQWYLRDNYWELHWTCATANMSENVCGGIASQANGIVYQGFRIRNVTFNNILANPLYPDQTDIDFVICFRFLNAIGSTSLAVDSSTTILASSGIYNVQIINFQTEIGNSNTSTILRVGILNYYMNDDANVTNDYDFIPTLLRVGGNIHDNDITGSNDGVAFFFDVGMDIGQSGGDLDLNPTECSSPTATSVTCRYFARKQLNSTTITIDQHGDYYPGLNMIAMGGTQISEGNEFNYYIPVKITAPFAYAFIALINSYQTYPTIKNIFKISGTIEIGGSNYKVPSPLFSAFTKYAATLDIVLDEYGTFQSQALPATMNTTQSEVIGSSFDDCEPTDVKTNLTLDGHFTTGFTDFLNDNPAKIEDSTGQFMASAHFTMHSFEKYWAGSTFTWSLDNSTDVPFKGTCTEMTIKSTLTQYLIVCPFEGTFESSATANISSLVSPTLTVNSWKWPDYYGKDADIGAHLRFLWTDRVGNLLSFFQTGVKGNAKLNCTLSTASQVFKLNTTQTKATIIITPLTTLLLKAATTTEGERKTMTIVLSTYETTSADPKITKCYCGISNVKCTVGLDTNSKDFTFTLTNTDTENDVTIPASPISLTFWLFSTSNDAETTNSYTAQIKATFYTNLTVSPNVGAKKVINDCQKKATWTSQSYESRLITVKDPSRHSLVIGSRTYFSFFFSTPYDVLDITKYKINLAFLDSPNSGLVDNLRCGLYTSTSISHDFSTFSYSTLSDIQIQYKQKQTTLDYPTEKGHASFTFKCYGGKVQENEPSSSSLITVENYYLSDKIGTGSCDNQSEKYSGLKTVSSESSVATITMNRLFDSVGQDSTYTFNVKVEAKTDINETTNVTTTSVRFLAGSLIYVEFARDLSPRFNKLGVIRCYHESYPTYCNYESERRISILARTDLSHNETYGHNFSVVGIQRPATLTNNKDMYFALVPYLSTFNTMEFHTSSISDETPSTLASTILPVVYYQQDSSNAIRSTYSFTMHIKIPANSVVAEIPLWVDFPEEFDEAMFLGWNPSCQLKNVQISENDTIDDFAAQCTTNITRRVNITLKADDNNTSERLYALTISGIPTYNYEQTQVNPPLVWFGSVTEPLIPTYKTNLGYFNGTSNLKQFTFTDSSTKQLLNWETNIPKCYIGTYSCDASIVVSTGANFQADITTITQGGVYSALFSLNPSTLKLNTGVSTKSFEIAPKSSTQPGLYQLTWTHDATASYSTLPPLFIVAVNEKLPLKALSTSYEVPHKGHSLPIIFSFADQMPESDITINGAATSDITNGTGTETSRYVTFKDAVVKQTLSYTEEYISSQIQFVVEGNKQLEDAVQPSSYIATLSWTLSGTNQKAYETPSTVSVTVVDAPTGTPELEVTPPDTSNQVGKMTVYGTCSHSGNLYYVVSQSQAATSIEYTIIQAATEEKKILETEIETVYTNPHRTFYGFALASNEGTSNTILMSGKLQSEAVYYLRMYCVNQVSTASEAQDITWTQQSNGGKPLVATMQFQQLVENSTNLTTVSLTTAQKKEVVCIICKETQTEKDRVFGTDGVACSEIGTVESSNSTNSTTRMLQTSDNNTEYFVVMPNLFTTDGSLDNAKSTLEDSSFKTALTASELLSGITVKSLTCSINSAYPSTPMIQSPSVSPSETSVSFTWAGVNNTCGFVFVGIVQYTNATVDPTDIQLKKNSGYSFDAFNKAFYQQDTAVTVAVTPATKCLDYKYFWIATNEDPDTYQYTTGVKTGTTKTIGCPTFSYLLNASMAILIALLFIMI